MCSEKSKHNCLISYWYSRVFFCTGIRRARTVQQQYNSTNILYLNILGIVVSVGKFMDDTVDIGSNPVSKHQIQPECGE